MGKDNQSKEPKDSAQVIVPQQVTDVSEVEIPKETPSYSAGLSYVSFARPLPLPSLLKEYESLLPGSADRLLTIYEMDRQQEREVYAMRLESEMRITAKLKNRDFLMSSVGFFSGLAIVVLGLVTGGVVYSIVALFLGGGICGVSLLGLAGKLLAKNKDGAQIMDAQD